MANNKAHGDLWDKAITANSVKDNGATVLMGGNIDSNNATVTNAPNASILGAGRQDQPSVQQSSYVGTTIANSNGNFAQQDARNFIVKGGNITTTLAGVAYTNLRGGANRNQITSINSLLTRKTVLIDSWNYVTGSPTYNASNPSDDDFGDVNGTHSLPTRAVPGNLVYLETGADTTTTAYKEKTG